MKVWEWLTSAEANAVLELRTTLEFDPIATASWWEAITARVLGGEQTVHNAGHDVVVDGIRVEVKYSREGTMSFGPLGHRQVFRWSALTGHGKRTKDADVVVLYGLTKDDHVHTWVIPARALVPPVPAATVNVPGNERGRSRSALEAYWVPADQLLPAVLMRCRS